MAAEELRFSDNCYEACPKIGRALRRALATQAMSGASEFDPAVIRREILGQFPEYTDDGDEATVAYEKSCIGPDAGAAIGAMMADYCVRQSVTTYIAPGEDESGYL